MGGDKRDTLIDFQIDMRNILILVGIVLLVFSVSRVWLMLEERSLAEDDKADLGYACDRWAESGRPQGEKLTEFMQGRGSYLVVTNRLFTIGGSNFETQFALKELRSGWSGALFVTTNRELIWLDSSGDAKRVYRGSLP